MTTRGAAGSPRRSGWVLLAGLVLAFAGGGAQAQQTRNCDAAVVEGAPTRIEVGGSWSTLTVGPLPQGAATIATGPGARVEVRCDDDLVLTIGAGAEVALAGLTRPAGPQRSVVLRLLQGIVGIDAPNRTWSAFEVRTPLAIASARSTSWLVEYAEPTGAGVFVRSGAVAVTGARGGATVTLTGGQGVTIIPGAASVAVLTWSEARRAGAAATLGLGWR